MKNTWMQNHFELINGEFSVEEGLDLICNLLQQKISFHTRKTTAHREMFGTEDLYALQRIDELKEMKTKLLDQFTNNHSQQKLQIHGSISLQSIANQ
ncbi:MAG: hypothetical protein ACKOWW_05640 [Flavobacteriales bacterium]